MWAQAHRFAADSNINTVWMAQFDEVDEGTAIFKVAKDQSEVPTEGQWLTLDADGESLPNDFYLQLLGEAQKMLAGDIALTNTLPVITPQPTSTPTNSPSAPNGEDSPTAGPTTQPTNELSAVPSSQPTESPTSEVYLIILCLLK